MAIIDNPVAVGSGGGSGTDTLVEMLESKTNLRNALAYSSITRCPMFTVNSAVKLFGSDDSSSPAGMFYYCRSLTSIPQLDTSNGTNFGGMFGYCTILTSIPQLDTGKGTSFFQMFSQCRSLTSIPQLDTSNGTNFNSMFYYCISLTSIPQLDTSKGTNLNSMFSQCRSLTSIPQLDTSNNTSFNGMFYDCRNLTSIPQLDTGKGTSFGGSNAFNAMFGDCISLTTVPQLNFASATSATALRGMFTNCPALSNTSLNNILASLLTKGGTATTNKTLKYIGLSSAQATTCTGLSNWAALSAAGWTTGY